MFLAKPVVRTVALMLMPSAALAYPLKHNGQYEQAEHPGTSASHPVSRQVAGAGVSGGLPRQGPDLSEHADEPDVVRGPGDGLTVERRSRA